MLTFKHILLFTLSIVSSLNGMEELPQEIIWHVALFIQHPTLKETLQKQKAFLLTNKKHAALLYDEEWMNTNLLRLQQQHHTSKLEIATLMGSNASKKIALDLMQEVQKREQEYAKWLSVSSQTNLRSYARFIFGCHEPDGPNLYKLGPYRSSSDNIPSLLYYRYGAKTHPLPSSRTLSDIVKMSLDPLTCNPIPDDPVKTPDLLQYWIDSGLLLTNDNILTMIWTAIVFRSIKDPSTFSPVYIQKLIEAKANINTTLEGVWVVSKPLDMRPPTTVLDATIYQIYNWKALKTAHTCNICDCRHQQRLYNLARLLRMLINAGARSAYEINAPTNTQPTMAQIFQKSFGFPLNIPAAERTPDQEKRLTNLFATTIQEITLYDRDHGIKAQQQINAYVQLLRDLIKNDVKSPDELYSTTQENTKRIL